MGSLGGHVLPGKKIDFSKIEILYKLKSLNQICVFAL
jgi:hypothetical protein